MKAIVPQHSEKLSSRATAETSYSEQGLVHRNAPIAALQQKIDHSSQIISQSKLQESIHEGRAIQRKINQLPLSIPTTGQVIQRGIITAFWDKHADATDLKIGEILAKDFESIVDNAAGIVDKGKGTTNSSLAYYDDDGSKARAAKRGTAIHEEAYLLIGNQLKGYGMKEQRCEHSKGRMDLVVKLPSGSMVIYDITTSKQAEKKHTKGRGYEDEDGVIAIFEISYDD